MTLTNEQIKALKAAAEKIATGYYTDDQWFHYLCLVHQSNILPLLAEREADKALIAEQGARLIEYARIAPENAARTLTVKLPTQFYDVTAAETIPVFKVSQVRDALHEACAAAGITLVVGGEDATN